LQGQSKGAGVMGEMPGLGSPFNSHHQNPHDSPSASPQIPKKYDLSLYK
jgi:hypothetical protein